MARKFIALFSSLSTVALTALLVFGTTTVSRADSITQQEQANFDHFLNNHPGVAKDLRRNPNLVNDSAYLHNHPDLREFLNTHHGVRDELRANPARFLARGGWYGHGGRYEQGKPEGWREHEAWKERH